MTALTTAEARRLADLEAVIERGQAVFVEVGHALLEIRDRRLYRATHSTFDAYTRERWGWSRISAYRHIEAAEVVSMLPIGNRPTNEAQARELAKAADPAAVWDDVVHAHEPSAITAAVIREHVERARTADERAALCDVDIIDVEPEDEEPVEQTPELLAAMGRIRAERRASALEAAETINALLPGAPDRTALFRVIQPLWGMQRRLNALAQEGLLPMSAAPEHFPAEYASAIEALDELATTAAALSARLTASLPNNRPGLPAGGTPR